MPNSKPKNGLPKRKLASYNSHNNQAAAKRLADRGVRRGYSL